MPYSMECPQATLKAGERQVVSAQRQCEEHRKEVWVLLRLVQVNAVSLWLWLWANFPHPEVVK